MEAREKIIDVVKSILVGPNPLPGYTQDNGEEILYSDPPHKTYIAGVLFPSAVIRESIQDSDTALQDQVNNINGNSYEESDTPISASNFNQYNIAESVIETDVSMINSFRQSAMGFTVTLSDNFRYVDINISVGAYESKKVKKPIEKKVENIRQIIMSDKEYDCYFRRQINAALHLTKEELPTSSNIYIKYDLFDESGKKIEGLAVSSTFRLSDSNDKVIIYTFTLMNMRDDRGEFTRPEDCWFQCDMKLSNDNALRPMPSQFSEEIDDEDYRLNALLYRNINTYAIGHGCAVLWSEIGTPKEIRTSCLPVYQTKAIVPAKSNAKLSMELYANNANNTLEDLAILCGEYESWIVSEELKVSEIKGPKYIEVAQNQISLCKKCLKRMQRGMDLLSSNTEVMKAFQLANKAMLMQQLHYKLPLTKYKSWNKDKLTLELPHDIVLPKLDDRTTWYNIESNVYGVWRPFQIAFVLINLVSMYDRNSQERDIVDLIWFPTGGGKTEAYLGLTAFTTFIRRIKNPLDCGTTVIMRYTLRLLTAQQYERAASLICAMEIIRKEESKLLGEERITIGLWVGQSLTENDSGHVVDRINKIHKEPQTGNVSVVLKCPWCGASMETFRDGSVGRTPGYQIARDRKHILFKCGNENCDFGKDDYPLPLNLFDDEIYNSPPTLLFGTVDKFAMLPYRPEAKSLFGGDGETTPPELIIQDELHLITGPLGSAVGLYETLVNELCVRNGSTPKIIASTATISHAKQQCNALYACGEENVFQFPVQGITYSDCFFANEDTIGPGRKYVGLFGSGASSSATASIYLFSALIYAAKAIDVSSESDRDPYWTNLAYFSSMRELGQAATWFIADIKEHLEVIYRTRLESTLDRDNRRYIYESGLAELTSRMGDADVPRILRDLSNKYNSDTKKALDMCLATNMVSVGVDIPRLGLMTVTGQPKSMSEYIQATSRVGRSANSPGLVFIIYNTSKSRDKSHYEKFQSQHSKLYFNVEPTSVTPFSRPLRDRALHAIFVALHRFFVEKSSRNDGSRVPTKEEFERIVNVITSRACCIDPNEVDDIKAQLNELLAEWDAWRPKEIHSFKQGEFAPLLNMAGTIKPKEWNDRGWDTPTSMRSVDCECALSCDKNLKKNSRGKY